MNNFSPNSTFNTSLLEESFELKRFARNFVPLDEYEDFDNEGWSEEIQIDNNQLSESQYMEEIKNIENLRTWSRISFYESSVAKPVRVETVQDEIIEKDIQQIVDNIPELKKIEQKFLDTERQFQGSQLPNSLNEYSERYSKNLPLIERSGKKFFRFYYLDGYKNLPEKGSINLFGKTYCPISKKYKSCNVTVGPLQRRLFIIPRNTLLPSEENVSNEKWNIVKEFHDKALKPLGISSFKYKFVWKKKLGEPIGNKYMVLEVQYSAHYPPVNTKREGTTFSKIYGSTNDCFENFILDKNLKGPCWLEVFNPEILKEPKTWCSFELSCTPEDVSPSAYTSSQNPPLTALSFYVPIEKEEDEWPKISMISWAVSYDSSKFSADSNVDICYCVFVNDGVSEGQKQALEIFRNFRRTVVKTVESELDLLVYFADQFQKIDPDIVVGYDFRSYGFHTLVNRLLANNKFLDINKFSKFQKNKNMHYLFVGRVICDLQKLMHCFISQKKQGLDSLYENLLNISVEQRCLKDTSTLSAVDRLVLSVILTTNESLYLLDLAFSTNVISSCLKLTNICGNLLTQTFSGNISKRCEFLLLHTFNENGFLIADFLTKHSKQNNKVTGGLVLDAKKGFYDNYVLLMDFRSLYPSIIVEYNICLSNHDSEETNPTEITFGLLPSLMKEIMSKRQSVKALMKSLDVKSSHYLRNELYQNSLKLSMNGIFGSLISKSFRFSCPAVADKITRKGREILRNSKFLLESKGFEVIYGDTDSIMINTKSADLVVAQDLAKQIENIINDQYSTIRLNLDTIFKRLLILSKKRYGGVAVEIDRNQQLQYREVLKGLDGRTDWPPYVCETGKRVIDYILSDLDFNEKVFRIKSFLHQTKEGLINHRVPTTSLCITKYLGQNPKEYSNITSYPHVRVAIRCMEKSISWFKKGDPVTYVMCRNKDKIHDKKPLHMKELDDYPEFEIDATFYLNKKLYPFICNICLPFGIQNAEIAAILDLKKLEFERKQSIRKTRTSFKSRHPFIFNCPMCKIENIINDEQKGRNLVTCQNLKCHFSPLKNYEYLGNQLVLAIRSFINKYYRYELQCNNKACKHISLRVSVSSNICSVCDRGKMEQIFNEMDLFLQLQFFRCLFDSKLSDGCPPWSRDAVSYILKALDNCLNHTGFRTVDLSLFFENI